MQLRRNMIRWHTTSILPTYFVHNNIDFNTLISLSLEELVKAILWVFCRGSAQKLVVLTLRNDCGTQFQARREVLTSSGLYENKESFHH
jgi:hypothetical protein